MAVNKAVWWGLFFNLHVNVWAYEQHRPEVLMVLVNLEDPWLQTVPAYNLQWSHFCLTCLKINFVLKPCEGHLYLQCSRGPHQSLWLLCFPVYNMMHEENKNKVINPALNDCVLAAWSDLVSFLSSFPLCSSFSPITLKEEKDCFFLSITL